MKKIKFLILLSLFLVLPVFASTYTIGEIAKHNIKADCWILISGKVYDVTAFFGYHPAGDLTLLPNCGKDATDAFQTQGGQETDHRPTTYSLLEKYYIGDLQGNISVNDPVVNEIKKDTKTVEKKAINEITDEAKIEINQANELGTTAVLTKKEVTQDATNFKYPGAIVSASIISLIYIVFGILYLLSSNRYLFRLKIKKFTSIVLFITFIFSGLIGLYLAFFNNVYFGEQLDLKSIHVSFSVVFAISSIIYIILHLKQILNYLAISKQKDSNL